MKFVTLILLLNLISSAHALPIDWHGALGFDTNLIGDFRRIDSTTDNSNTNGTSMEVPFATGSNSNANWQSYLFRLEPHIIVNDTATIKAEFTSGYGRGGRVGDSTSPSQNKTLGNALYLNNVDSGGNNSLTFNQLYAEIFADTATYIVGRHSQDFGLGAVVNSGQGMWDRFPYLRDGLTVKIKIGNFQLEPYWTRQGAGSSLTKATRVKDSGISLKYSNTNRDMKFGLLYSKKKSGSDPDVYNSTGTTRLGSTDVKLIDIFFKKSFSDISLGVEVPIISGDIGNAFGQNTNYKTKAVIFQGRYKASDSWTFGVDAGKVDGDDGTQGTYGAMYLNPNFQIANLMFRYNLRAVSNTNNNVYESYINNTLYAKLHAKYSTERWDWTFAGIYATADQVALGSGDVAYNHDTNQRFTSTVAQSDDLGFELDTGFKYRWNSEITVGGTLGWLFTGDYYAYTNGTQNEVKNSYALQLNTMIRF